MTAPTASLSPAAKAPAVLPKAAKPTASASSKKPSVPKSAVKNGPASKPKPKPKPATSGAKPPVKQAVPKLTIAQPPTASTTNKSKPRAKILKAKKDTSTQPSTRPTLSDGKVEREIWHPSDGNGDPSPDLVEKFRSKKGGHPTWKLYTGRNVPKQPTDSNPPRFAYLDDKAAWDILHSKTWTASEKHRYWPLDFTPQGRISFLRAHRGRPAYERDGKTFASIRKQKDKRYWMHGCHPSPEEEPSTPASAPTNDSVVAEGSAAAAPTDQTVQANAGTKNQVPEKAPGEEQTPLAEKVSPPEQAPEPQPVPEPQTPPPSAPTELLNNTAPPSPASSVQSIKRPASPDNPANPAPKRQRMAITPYTIPADVQARDSELSKLRKELRDMRDREDKRDAEMDGLRQRAAVYHRAAMGSNQNLQIATKKGEAFRRLALKLYARTIDQQEEIAKHHASMLRIEKSANDLMTAAGILAADARTEIELATKTHQDLDDMLDGSEQTMREAGLQEEFQVFVEEAMALE